MSGLKSGTGRRKRRRRGSKRREPPGLWERYGNVVALGLAPAFCLLFLWAGLTDLKFQSTLGPSRTGQITRIEPGGSYSRLNCRDERMFLSDGGPELKLTDCNRASETIGMLAHNAHALGHVVRLNTNQRGDVVVLSTPTSALDVRASYDRSKRVWGRNMAVIAGLLLASPLVLLLLMSTPVWMRFVTRALSKPEPSAESPDRSPGRSKLPPN